MMRSVMLMVLMATAVTAGEIPWFTQHLSAWDRMPKEERKVYNEVWDKVTKGETVYLSTGEGRPANFSCPHGVPGLEADCTYRCYLKNGEPVAEKVAPVVSGGCPNGRCYR